MCIHTYIHTCTDICVYMYMYIYVYTYVYMYIHLYIYIHTYMYCGKFVNMYVHVHTLRYVHTSCVCMCICTCMYMYICTYLMYIYMYIYMHIYMYIRSAHWCQRYSLSSWHYDHLLSSCNTWGCNAGHRRIRSVILMWHEFVTLDVPKCVTADFRIVMYTHRVRDIETTYGVRDVYITLEIATCRSFVLRNVTFAHPYILSLLSIHMCLALHLCP